MGIPVPRREQWGKLGGGYAMPPGHGVPSPDTIASAVKDSGRSAPSVIRRTVFPSESRTGKSPAQNSANACRQTPQGGQKRSPAAPERPLLERAVRFGLAALEGREEPK